MNANLPTAKLRLGRIVATPGVLEIITNEDLLSGISRHQSGDWGELSAEDRAANDEALLQGTRIVSAYRSATGVKFWLITEADRSITTVLLPGEY